jgi:hypothetical protein
VKHTFATPEGNKSPLGQNIFLWLACQHYRGKMRHALRTRTACPWALGPRVSKKVRDAFSLGLGPCAAMRFLGIGPLKGRLVGHRPIRDGKRLRPMRRDKARGKRRGLGVGTQAASSFALDEAGAARGSRYPQSPGERHHPVVFSVGECWPREGCRLADNNNNNNRQPLSNPINRIT